MTPDQELIAELKKINKKLDVLTNPLKNAGYNFVSGIWRSLGSLFGTVFVAAAIVYLLSRLNLNFDQLIKDYIPAPQLKFEIPQMNLDNPNSI